MIRLGLTGSIGMGKSTTADMFRAEGIAVIDADLIVHELYRGAAAAPIEQAFPGVTDHGVVDRARLAKLLVDSPHRFVELEKIVHPLVWERERQLLAQAEESGEAIVVLDIPLLFENKAGARVDKIAVVSCGADLQHARVMSRPGMTEEKFSMILARQMPDAEKRSRADFVIDTAHGLDHARGQVRSILSRLQQEA
jgi:dephospho-CoA kinase